MDVKLLYQWKKAAYQLLPAGPAEAAEVHALRQATKRLTQELKMLKSHRQQTL